MQYKRIVIYILSFIIILTLCSCKAKKDDTEVARPYTEQTVEKTDIAEQQTINNDINTPQDDVNTSATDDSETVAEDNEQPLEQQPQHHDVDEDTTEQKAVEVFGEGILEYVDISKVAKIEYRCIGENLSNVTFKTLTTLTDEKQIKDTLDTLSKVKYTAKEKLYDKEKGDYIIGMPTFYQMWLLDKNNDLIYNVCLMDVHTKYKDDAGKYDSNDNIVCVENYEYQIEDNSSIRALVNENIMSKCDCLLCVSEYVVPALDCDVCTAAKTGFFCTCDK